jgi:hypothetical protein
VQADLERVGNADSTEAPRRPLIRITRAPSLASCAVPICRITRFRRRPITCLAESLSPSREENDMTLENEQIVRHRIMKDTTTTAA